MLEDVILPPLSCIKFKHVAGLLLSRVFLWFRIWFKPVRPRLHLPFIPDCRFLLSDLFAVDMHGMVFHLIPILSLNVPCIAVQYRFRLFEYFTTNSFHFLNDFDVPHV